MHCQHCGKNNSITINHQKYCANCGEPYAQKQPKPAAATSQPVHHQPEKSPLLDLRKARSHRNAQAIHGSRPVNAVKRAEVAARYKQAERQERLNRINRSHKISKFHNPSPELGAIASSLTDLDPHHEHSAKSHAKHSATSHAAPAHQVHKRQPKKRGSLLKSLRVHPRVVTGLAIGAIVLVLGGYISYLNYPSIATRVAASQAGIEAQVPRYTPSGYTFKGPVSHSAGQLTIRFNSNSDDNFLTITQRQTSWDSATLLENYVKTTTDKYLTFQQNGLTVYLFNENNAAWVNSGNFFTIDGNTKLSTEQILKIAASL